MIYRQVSSVSGLECTADGQFRYNGKPKKVCYPFIIDGRKATAKLQFLQNGKREYLHAARCVAEAWKRNYSDRDYLIFKDGDIHNIRTDNLMLCGRTEYYDYIRRNCGHQADSINERKRKLQLVIDEASLTLDYFKTLKFDGINRHVTEYLYDCLMKYTISTLHLGEKTAMNIVPEALGRMYECIMNGMCLYNYERYCKKLLLNYKKKGSFGLTGKVPKPIQINVEQLNLDCLWERYKVSKLR